MGIIALLAVALLASVLPPSPVDGVSRLNHPQVQFCLAGFVLRGEVRGVDAKRSPYSIRVISLYKDDVDISQAEGTKTLGAGLNLKLFNSPYSFPLRVGQVYVLAGQLHNRKLHVRRTDYVFPFPSDNEWKNVSLTQREGLAFRYKLGCKCRIGRCYGGRHCLQKVRGCEHSDSEKRPRFDVCRMKHQFCRMMKSHNDGKVQRCQWETRKTKEFKNCEEKLQLKSKDQRA